MNHWMIRAIDNHREPIAGVYSELIAGRARMGWSNHDELDLRMIAEAKSAGRALTDKQEGAADCLPFFEGIRVHDVLWYSKIPAAGRVTVVRVTGDYGYDCGVNGVYDGGKGYDLRSFRPCEAVAPSLDLNGEIIGSDVRQWLHVPGRIAQASTEYAVVLSTCLDRITETMAQRRFGGDPSAGRGVARQQSAAAWRTEPSHPGA